MMEKFRLLLLDDEEIVLMGIRKVFDFEEYGYELAAAMSRPLRALEQLTELRPDLIVTDIRMPLMTGLEFAKKAKELLPDVEIVILSGYDDFTYAQTAVKIGVRDYLLKPIMKEDFAAMLGQMHKRIEEKKSQKRSYHAMSEMVKKSVNELKTTFFLQLVESEQVNWNRMQQMYESLNMDFEDKKFILIKFYFDQMKFQGDATSEVGKMLIDMESALSGYGEIESFLSDECGYVFLYGMETDKDALSSEIGRSILAFSEEKRQGGVPFVAGISHVHQGIREIFYANHESDQMIWSADVKADDSMQNLHHVLQQNLSIPYDRLEGLFRAITVGNPESIEDETDRIYENLQNMDERRAPYHSGSTLSQQYCYSISFLILLRMYQIQYKYGLTQKVIPEKLLELRNLRYQYPGVQEQCEMIKEFAQTLSELIQETSITAPSKMVMAAVDYVQEHFSENISLASVADAIGFNKNYLCDMFKKEVGITFINYVTNVRIEKAKEMLQKSDMKMYEISFAVGFNDYTYFSQIFKKRTGMTLSAYRKAH